MTFIYSLHVLEQIELRGLSKSVIDDVLNSPGRIIAETNGVNIYQKVVIENYKPYTLTEYLLISGRNHL